MATEYSKKKEKIISPMDVGNKKIEYIKKKEKKTEYITKKKEWITKKKEYPIIGKDY